MPNVQLITIGQYSTHFPPNGQTLQFGAQPGSHLLFLFPGGGGLIDWPPALVYVTLSPDAANTSTNTLSAAVGMGVGGYWCFPGYPNEPNPGSSSGVDCVVVPGANAVVMIVAGISAISLQSVGLEGGTLGVWSAVSNSGPACTNGCLCLGLESTGNFLVAYAAGGVALVVEYDTGASTWGTPVPIDGIVAGTNHQPLSAVIDENDTLHVVWTSLVGSVSTKYYTQYSVAAGANTPIQLTTIPTTIPDPSTSGNVGVGAVGAVALISTASKTLVVPYVQEAPAIIGHKYFAAALEISPYTSSTPTVADVDPLTAIPAIPQTGGAVVVSSYSDGTTCTVFFSVTGLASGICQIYAVSMAGNPVVVGLPVLVYDANVDDPPLGGGWITELSGLPFGSGYLAVFNALFLAANAFPGSPVFPTNGAYLASSSPVAIPLGNAFY